MGTPEKSSTHDKIEEVRAAAGLFEMKLTDSQ